MILGKWSLIRIGQVELSIVSLLPVQSRRYITKSNLQVLLGDAFPEGEIDCIMNEVSSNDGLGISYSDFLSQWRDDKEAFLKQWEQHMVPETVVHESKSLYESDDHADLVSEVSFDIPFDNGASNFHEAKTMSERKKKDLTVSIPVSKA